MRIRRWRDSAGVKPGSQVRARLSAEGYEATADTLARLARVELSDDGAGGALATVAVPGGTLEVLGAEGLDLAELERRQGVARERLEEQIARAQSKLSNEGFVANAPADVVDAERSKLANLQAELETL